MLEIKDIPCKEVLRDFSGSISVDLDLLIPFREKFTSGEIIEFISKNELLKSNERFIDPTSEDAIVYNNCLLSLFVTWDAKALEAIKKIFLLNPGLYTLRKLFFELKYSKFPEKEMLLNFLNSLIKEFPEIKEPIEESSIIESLEYDLANGVIPLKLKRAIPPEEREFRLDP